MVAATDAKAIVERRRRSALASRSNAKAFDQKQSAYARRAEERLILAEATTTPFAEVRTKTASRSVMVAGVRDRSRRSAKFNLTDGSAAGGTTEVGRQLGDAPNSLTEHTEGQPADGRHPLSAKRERFEELISTTRRTRAELQRDRAERNRAAEELDAQFAEIQALLPKRDKRQEEIDHFKGLLRPEVKQLMDASRERQSKGGREFVLNADGELRRIDSDSGGSNRNTPPFTAPAVKVLTEAAAPTSALDDFDSMLGAFRMESRRAHAVDRILLPEEEAAREVQQQLLMMDREERPAAKEHAERTRSEWVAAGGDDAYRLGEEDGDDAAGLTHPLGDGTRVRLAVDEVLRELEAFCASGPEAFADLAQCSSTLSSLASKLWHAAVKQKAHAEESFKLLLIDAQRRVQQRRLPLTLFHQVAFLVALKVFPTTDHRHPVVTPLCILLGHICTSVRLDTTAACAEALWCGANLLHATAASKRFASEVVVVALNIIALQLPKRKLEPDTIGGVAPVFFPLMDRCVEPLLYTGHTSVEVTPRPLRLFTMRRDQDDSDVGERGAAALRLDVLAAAYRLLVNAAALYADSPSFEAVFGTNFTGSLAKLIDPLQAHPAIRELHMKAVECVATLHAAVAMERTPLAMRSFRPRPLRQYEPLMVDDTPSAKKELQQLRQDVREDHRRVVRSVQAESRVERRSREAELTREDAMKRAKLTSIMAELQQQQHIMKTADALRTKATTKKRRAVNVVPRKRGNGANDDDDD